MNIIQVILQIVNSSSQPLGWYGIDTRLGRRGIIVEGNLVSILDNLVQQGYLEHQTNPAHPHGVYAITAQGREFVDQHKQEQP
ncbi:MAG: hypothetical protein HGA19_17940 [Oscillochloris sp.]|nr:hypothetical protein [Oscillochloris sp.]